MAATGRSEVRTDRSEREQECRWQIEVSHLFLGSNVKMRPRGPWQLFLPVGMVLLGFTSGVYYRDGRIRNCHNRVIFVCPYEEKEEQKWREQQRVKQQGKTTAGGSSASSSRSGPAWQHPASGEERAFKGSVAQSTALSLNPNYKAAG